MASLAASRSNASFTLMVKRTWRIFTSVLIESDSTHGRDCRALDTLALQEVPQYMPGTLRTTWLGPSVAIGGAFNPEEQPVVSAVSTAKNAIPRIANIRIVNSPVNGPGGGGWFATIPWRVCAAGHSPGN